MNSISYARSPIECSICKPFWHKETEEGHLVHKRCMRKKQYIDVFCLITLEQNNVCPWNINNVNWCYLTLLQWFRVILLQEFRIIWPEVSHWGLLWTTDQTTSHFLVLNRIFFSFLSLLKGVWQNLQGTRIMIKIRIWVDLSL